MRQRKIGSSKRLFDGTLIITIQFGKFSEKDVQGPAEPKGGEKGWQRLPGINTQARFKGQIKQKWGEGELFREGARQWEQEIKVKKPNGTGGRGR